MKPWLGRMKNVWRDLPVSHKLYSVVGVMAVLIATELFTLLFAMNILSAVRAFVHGEGLWSKAQKGAVLELHNYARTFEVKHYQAYLQHLQIPLGDHDARVEMNKPNMNMEVIRKGFLQGGVHPHDILPMVQLMTRFHRIHYIHRAIEIWGEADELIFLLMAVGDELHATISKAGHPDRAKIQDLMNQIFILNNQLTEVENQFSFTLGEASRWLENSLMILLLIAVVTVESTGLGLTIAFSRSLNRTLTELNAFATEVGAGEFNRKVPVRSGDELGELANALNKMAVELKDMSGERQIAERANRIKNLFLANMSHEIRTPLNAILGFVDLLKENSLSRAESLKYLEIIERTGYNLATIINDILDISKVEAGKLEIEMTDCSLKQILRDVESVLSLRCEEKGIRLKFYQHQLPDMIRTDGTRLKQILLNLIGNAIKFTNKGHVTATFECKSLELICKIEDTGVGIPRDSTDRLFQPFSQIDLSVRKQFGGTGLGLILSRRLARLLGGDVKLLHSEVGVGSTFEIRIGFSPPIQPGDVWRKPEAPPPSQTLKGKRVLLVEDSLDNQLLAQQYLAREGAQVDIANHGLEALEAVSREKYDLVLMDMQMPVMDGYTATAQLRRMGYRTPIIALTAHAMKADLDKCLTVGCNDYLCKPFRRANLIELMAQYVAEAA